VMSTEGHFLWLPSPHHKPSELPPHEMGNEMGESMCDSGGAGGVLDSGGAGSVSDSAGGASVPDSAEARGGCRADPDPGTQTDDPADIDGHFGLGRNNIRSTNNVRSTWSERRAVCEAKAWHGIKTTRFYERADKHTCARIAPQLPLTALVSDSDMKAMGKAVGYTRWDAALR
jgi:hypothetical protein